MIEIDNTKVDEKSNERLKELDLLICSSIILDSRIRDVEEYINIVDNFNNKQKAYHMPLSGNIIDFTYNKYLAHRIPRS